MENKKNILLVQLGSFGDCLFVTSIAKQIKELDYPNCNLTWMIGEKYKTLLENNPYVDKIITVDYNTPADRDLTPRFLDSIKENFDEIIITDFCPENFKTAYGTTRGALFRTYGTKIKDIEPQIFLTQQEIHNVKEFAKINHLNDYYCILLEPEGESGQTPLNIEMIETITKKIVEKNQNIKFVVSSKNPFPISNPNFINANSLSYRENAELTKYCKLLFGISSGITWLNTSNWAAKIPMLIVVHQNEKYAEGMLSASVKDDYDYWELSDKNLIEFGEVDVKKIVDCILTIAEKSFEDAKLKYPSNKTKTKEEIDSSCLKYFYISYKRTKYIQKYFTYMFLSTFVFGKKRIYYKRKYKHYKELKKFLKRLHSL